MKEFLKLVLWAVVLFLLQVFVFSPLGLFGQGNIFVYIMFFLIIPLRVKPIPLMLIAFFFGLLVDNFTGSYGIHCFSATLIAGARQYVQRLFFDKDELENTATLFVRFSADYYKYTFTMTLLYSLSVFLLQAFSFRYIPAVLLKTVVSTVATFVVLFFIQATLLKRYNER